MRTNFPRTGLLIASGALATLVLSAGPALAAQRGQEHSRGGGGQSQGQAAPRQAAPAPQQHSAPAPQVQNRFAGRPQVAPAPQQNFDRRAVAAPQARSFSAGPQGERFDNRYQGRFESRAPVVVGRAAPRPVYGNGYRYEAPRYFTPTSHFYGGAIFSRPYYAFRPRYSFGFGLVVGYPVAFPNGYYYNPYAYSYGYPVYGYAEPIPTYSDGYYGGYDSYYGSDAYVNNAATFGGVTFDIQPTQAAIYIDGKFVGTVAQFSPEQPPLSLTLGRHHVDLRLAGFQTMSFDVDVLAGQVTPYQGGLVPIR
jgi:hypothetical protein